jgi:hypothetical protein
MRQKDRRNGLDRRQWTKRDMNKYLYGEYAKRNISKKQISKELCLTIDIIERLEKELLEDKLLKR